MTTYYVKTDARGVTNTKELEASIQHRSELVVFGPEDDLADIYGMSSMFPVKLKDFDQCVMQGTYVFPGEFTWYRAVQIGVKKALGTYRGEFKE